MIRRKIYAAAGIAAAAGALVLGALGGAGVASASTTPVTSYFSQFLGGHIAAGVTRFGDLRTTVTDLPDLSGYTADCIAASSTATTGSAAKCAGTVGIGGTEATATSGGEEFGIGLVWDAPTTGPGASTCSSDQYTVEANSLAYFASKPVPVPLPNLRPVSAFGGDICVSPGATEAVEVYDSSLHHEIIDEAGPTAANEVVVGGGIGTLDQFFAAGLGVDVTSGANAGLLPTGSLASFGPSGLTELASNHAGAHQSRVQFATPPTYAVVGTVSGNSSSPSNPVTLEPTFTNGPGSASTVTVP